MWPKGNMLTLDIANHNSRGNKMIRNPSSSLKNTTLAKGKFSILVVLILLGALLRFEYITQPFIEKFRWRQASTAMMAQNFYRGHWNILYPQVDWGGPGPNYQGREFQTVTYIAANLYRVFGPHEWVDRCVTVTFGLWGIFVLHQLTVNLHLFLLSGTLLSGLLSYLLPGNRSSQHIRTSTRQKESKQ